jgi:anaerobic ribonucleoside-triphosphate reductase activating protein
MLISRAHYPVHTLGYGIRAGVWTQGCRLACDGCLARDTWDADPSHDMDVADLLSWLEGHRGFDGLTLSGGEPLDQAEAIVELLSGFRKAFGWEVDVLCYTGYTTSSVRRANRDVLALVDAIVTGPYRRGLPTRHPLMGSSNQEVVITTDLGRQRYADLPDVERRDVQASASGRMIHVVGIPNPGDLEALEAALIRQGLLVQASWRSA